MTTITQAPATEITDVNAAFAAERASQIATAYAAQEQAERNQREAVTKFDERLASGKLVPLGNGLFRVNDPGSWDNNETLRMVQPTVSAVPLILPETGLDESADGTRELLYTATPTWHNAEGVGLVPGGTTDIETVLNLGGINFTVEQEPVLYRPSKGDLRRKLTEAPEQFVNYRSDTSAALGVVGKRYRPTHPVQQLRFLQELAERDDIPFESAGPLNGGRQVFVSMLVPDTVTIDDGGLNEQAKLYFAAINDNTGNGLLQVVVSPWRPICKNTNRFALRDAKARWGVRHTGDIPAKIRDEAKRTLGLVYKYAERFAEEETLLARTKVTTDQVEDLLTEIGLLGLDGKSPEEATVRQRKAEERRAEKLFELWGIESGRVGPSAYALEQVVTGYADHVAQRRVTPDKLAAARASAVLLGNDDDLKSKAHRKLLTLTNR